MNWVSLKSYPLMYLSCWRR